MIRNYITVAFRNLAKNKLYVTINTLGMGVALACCLTAYLLIGYNLEFDKSFKDIGSVVKVLDNIEQPNDRYNDLVVPTVMAPWAARDIAGIEKFTRYVHLGGSVSYGDKAFNERIEFADAAFFEMFHLELKSGTQKNFENQETIFLSEALAKKYFGDEDAIGKTLTIGLKDTELDVVVGGVLKKIPLNSSFTIDALMRMEQYLAVNKLQENDWANDNSTVFFKLTDVNQRQTIAGQLKKYSTLRNRERKESASVGMELLPFREPVLRGDVSQSNLRHPIPFVALLIFGMLGFIILLIACFNLTNTTMGINMKRLKEIGVRKVVGSSRTQIAVQFFIEMVITVFLAIIAGWLIAQLIVPEFATMWQFNYSLSEMSGANLIATLTILLFVAALLAGIYPALLSSKFKPVALLKGGVLIKGTNRLTRALLVVQFSLSVILMIGGITFIQNISYQQTIGFGYNHSNLLTVTLRGDQSYQRLKNGLQGNPLIEDITAAENHISPYAGKNENVKIDTSVVRTKVYAVAPHYFSTIGLDVVIGREFRENNPMDYESSALVDEKFVNHHKLTNPLDTKIIYLDRTYRIIGIVKNHLNGLKEDEQGDHFYVMSSPERYSSMVVRTADGKMKEAQEYIEIEWKKINPGKPFESFTQESLLYEEANGYNYNLKKIFLFLTVLGCLLSISGIYSLASLNVQKRTKEIGIRKVLGGSVKSIIQLINKEFAIILTIAAVLGGAGGFFMMSALLDSLYRQHVTVGIAVMILSGLFVFTVGILATSGTIFRAAVANPTQSLRSE